jgi:hypothetical protein
MEGPNGLFLCSVIYYFVLIVNLIYLNISAEDSRVHECLDIMYIYIQCMIL